jgi:hypothetical protein
MSRLSPGPRVTRRRLFLTRRPCAAAESCSITVNSSQGGLDSAVISCAETSLKLRYAHEESMVCIKLGVTYVR